MSQAPQTPSDVLSTSDRIVVEKWARAVKIANLAWQEAGLQGPERSLNQSSHVAIATLAVEVVKYIT